jgi:hypothetical protein
VPDQAAEQLERKVGAIRENLDGLVTEFDHRRHRIARRYVRPVALVLAVAGVGALGAFVWYRASRKPPSRIARMRVALARAMAHPDRVAAPAQPSIANRVAAAAAGAAVSIGVRRLLLAVFPSGDPNRTEEAA